MKYGIAYVKNTVDFRGFKQEKTIMQYDYDSKSEIIKIIDKCQSKIDNTREALVIFEYDETEEYLEIGKELPTHLSVRL